MLVGEGYILHSDCIQSRAQLDTPLIFVLTLFAIINKTVIKANDPNLK